MFEERRRQADAGVVVHDVESPEFVDRGAYQPLDLFGIANVGRDESAAYRTRDLLTCAVRQITDDDLGTLLGEDLGGRFPDTRPAAGYNRDAIGDSSVRDRSLLVLPLDSGHRVIAWRMAKVNEECAVRNLNR